VVIHYVIGNLLEGEAMRKGRCRMKQITLSEKLFRAQNSLCMLRDSCQAIGRGADSADIGEIWFCGVADCLQDVLDTVDDVIERYGDELGSEVTGTENKGFQPKVSHEAFMRMMNPEERPTQ